MRCIFTNRTIAIRCFSIGTNPTIGTNGDPSYHHQHQWSLFVSIGPPSSLFASPSENLIKVLPLRNKKVRGSYSNGNFFKLACSWALNGSPHSKKEKRRWFSPHSPTQQGREAWGRGYNRQDIRNLSTKRSWFTNGMAGRLELDRGRGFRAKCKSLSKTTSRTPTDNSVENRFQRFGLSFVSFLRRKHDFRRGISTFVWRILFEEPKIWTSGFNLRTRVLKSVTAAQECLDMRRGCHAAKILPVGVFGTKNVPST